MGERLHKLRKERSLTQSDLAERTDVSRTTINNIEKGEQSITLELFVRIADALSYDPPTLLRHLTSPSLSVDNSADSNELKIRNIIEKSIRSQDGIDNKHN